MARFFTVLPGAFQKLLAATTAVGTSITGDTNDHDLLSQTMPANSMGVNNVLRMKAFFRTSGNAAKKTIKVKLGGATIFSDTVTIIAGNSIDWIFDLVIWNQNATNAQGLVSCLIANNTITAGNYQTATADTTKPLLIEITLALQNSADSFTPNFGMVELLGP